MLQLLFHLVGDYWLQNHWMATNKKKDSWLGFTACATHCLLYTLVFAFYPGITTAGLVAIFTTHFIIDHTNLVPWLIALKNGVMKTVIREHSEFMGGASEVQVSDTSNCGYSKDTPFALSVWLMIIQDNTLHLVINALAIAYLCPIT